MYAFDKLRHGLRGSITAFCVLALVGCASGTKSQRDVDVTGDMARDASFDSGGAASARGTSGAAPGANDLQRQVMPPPNWTNEGNDARAQGLGGGLNPGGQAGQANQASGINTPAHRAELGRIGGPVRGQPMTDIAVIFIPDRDSLIGRPVMLEDVIVQEVVSDLGFWIGPDRSQRMFVQLDRALDDGQMEWIVDVNRGNRISLAGVVRVIPDADTVRARWGLEPNEEEAVLAEPVFIEATRIEFTR